MKAVTLINSFEVPAGREDEFFRLWQQVNIYMQAKPGYIRHTLYRSLAPDASFTLRSGNRQNTSTPLMTKAFAQWSANQSGRLSDLIQRCTSRFTKVTPRPCRPQPRCKPPVGTVPSLAEISGQSKYRRIPVPRFAASAIFEEGRNLSKCARGPMRYRNLLLSVRGSKGETMKRISTMVVEDDPAVN